MPNLLIRFQKFYGKQDKLIFFSVVISLLIAILTILPWLIYYRQLPPSLPLFNSLPWGESQLIDKSHYIILPAIITLITLGNLILSWHLHSSQFAIKRVLGIASAVTAFLILIAAIKMISVFI